MSHIVSSKSSAGVTAGCREGFRPQSLRFLLGCLLRGLFGRGFLARTLLGFGRVVFLRLRLHLFRFRFLFWKLGSLEALSAKGDLGDPHRRESLPVPAQLLVLLL